MAINKGLLLLGVGAVVAYQIAQAKKKGVVGSVWEGAFGESDPDTSRKSTIQEVAAGGGKQIRIVSPAEFGEVDRDGIVGNDYEIVVDFANGTTYPWKGVLTVTTTEDVGSAPVINAFNLGDFEVPLNTTVRKIIPLRFHGYYLNFGTTTVLARVSLGTVEQSFTYNVD